MAGHGGMNGRKAKMEASHLDGDTAGFLLGGPARKAEKWVGSSVKTRKGDGCCRVAAGVINKLILSIRAVFYPNPSK